MKRILVIEDERAEYESLVEALTSEGHDLIWTQTAHEGLRRANDEHFDLVLLDVNLSDLDPWQVLDRFNALHPFLPVVMLAERPGPLPRAALRGADACLDKPLDRPHLLEIVKQLLAESHQARMSRLMDSLHGWLRVPQADELMH